jgi:hypothetical protein
MRAVVEAVAAEVRKKTPCIVARIPSSFTYKDLKERIDHHSLAKLIQCLRESPLQKFNSSWFLRGTDGSDKDAVDTLRLIIAECNKSGVAVLVVLENLEELTKSKKQQFLYSLLNSEHRTRDQHGRDSTLNQFSAAAPLRPRAALSRSDYRALRTPRTSSKSACRAERWLRRSFSTLRRPQRRSSPRWFSLGSLYRATRTRRFP